MFGKIDKSYKALLIGIFLLFASLFTSCERIKYSISGTKVQAEVTGFKDILVKSGGRFSGSKVSDSVKRVMYRWRTEDGKIFVGSSSVDIDWETPADKKVNISYIPNDRNTAASTRMVGSKEGPVWIMFLISFLLIIGSVITIVEDGKKNNLI